MNKHDYAIVVGIHNYPGITHLKGTLNDANDFINWLKQENGGSVPEENIQAINHFFPDEVFPDVLDAEPTREDIKREFDRLNRKAKKARDYFNEDKLREEGINFYTDPDEGVRYYGRRLYLFFAGHGYNRKNSNTAVSMLAANGDYKDLSSNGVDTFECLKFYENSGYFKEVILITDCCRTPKYGGVGNKILMEDPVVPPRSVRTAYMLSCQNGQVAREKEFDGKFNGIFSRLLLEAFTHANVREGSRSITYSEIKSYVDSNKNRFLGNQKPEIHGNQYGEEIELVVRANDFASRLKVSFHLPENWIGGQLHISDTAYNPIDTNIPITASDIVRELPMGILRYKVNKGESVKEGFFEVDTMNTVIDFENQWNDPIAI